MSGVEDWNCSCQGVKTGTVPVKGLRLELFVSRDEDRNCSCQGVKTGTVRVKG